MGSTGHSSALATQNTILESCQASTTSNGQSTYSTSETSLEGNATDISSVAQELTNLLETARSHGASEPDVSDGGFIEFTPGTLPQTEFIYLGTRLRQLNPHLKTLQNALRRSKPSTGQDILRAHSRTLQDLFNLDDSTLRAAHGTLTRLKGLILVGETGRQLMPLINEGTIFFDRVKAISERLNELTSQPSTVPEATKDASS